MAKNDRAGKAAFLAELLGETRVSELRKSGLLPPKVEENADHERAAWHRSRLIEKFRERGLISGREQANSKPDGCSSVVEKDAGSEGQPRSEFSRGGIGSRLTKHLAPERLKDEHPAVIALFLRAQSPQIRSRVLRGLPGSQARSVMRILKGRETAKVPFEETSDDNTSFTESHGEAKIKAKNVSSVQSKTRRAL